MERMESDSRTDLRPQGKGIHQPNQKGGWLSSNSATIYRHSSFILVRPMGPCENSYGLHQQFPWVLQRPCSLNDVLLTASLSQGVSLKFDRLVSADCECCPSQKQQLMLLQGKVGSSELYQGTEDQFKPGGSWFP